MEYSQKTCHPKRWNTEFLKYRNFKDQTPYVRLKSDIQSVFGGIENFMQDLEESLPSDQVEAVLQFCRGVSSDDLRPGVPAAGRYRRAWLDDRKYSPIRDRGICRRYTRNPLTPSQLYQILQARLALNTGSRLYQRYNNTVMPDVDRRLIYITKMIPHYVLAITEAAPWHQVESLRDALWKHLTYQMSVKVNISESFPIFHLEFHLPYLSLRLIPPGRQYQDADCGGTWIDLSFLKLQDKLQDYALFEARTSFVIVGSDNYRWDGYCFATDEEEDLLDEDSDEIHMDPIFGDGDSCRHDADLPIWDPRKYFLAVLKSRITQVSGQFQYLIRVIAENIQQYESSHLPTLSQQPRKHAQSAKADFDRVNRTTRLLSRMANILTKYIESWEKFSGYDGDICYFSDIMESEDHSSNQARLSIDVIKQAFITLQQQKREVIRLEELCDKSAKILILEVHNAARNSETITGLTASFVNPIVVAAALFSMPEAVKLNPKSFVLAIVIIVVLMRLLMFIPGLFGWWPMINASIKAGQWDRWANIKIATTQMRDSLDEATYDVEMHPFDDHAYNLDVDS